MFGRQAGTKQYGGRFDEREINAVWCKARVIPGYDAAVWRRDTCGAVIHRPSYGLLTKSGWEIDHILPVSRGGTDVLENLQPLQWENNRHKGDNYPNWSCRVAA